MRTLLSQLDRLLEVGDTLLELGNTLIEELRRSRYVRWRTDRLLHCVESLATPMGRRLVMRVDAQVQRAAIRNHALETRFTAQAVRFDQCWTRVHCWSGDQRCRKREADEKNYMISTRSENTRYHQ